MTTRHANNPRVTFVEMFTQPDATAAKDDASSSLETNKQKVERPSLVIAGDAKSLEVVKTLHSPKSPKSPSIFSGGSYRSPSVHQKSNSSSPKPVIVTNETASIGCWDKLVQNKWQGKADAALTLLGLIYSIYIYGTFMKWYGNQTNIDGFTTISDQLFFTMATNDYSVLLPIVVYGSVVLSIVYGLAKPNLLLEYSQTHIVLMWVRMIAMYLAHLEIPRNIISLPRADETLMMYPLIFSGQSSASCIGFLVCRSQHRRWKAVFVTLMIATMIMEIMQKTQSALAVFAAPFFAYTALGFVQELRRIGGGLYVVPLNGKKMNQSMTNKKE